MKTMSDYTIYCTEEQTKKALELGVSIDYVFYNVSEEAIKECHLVKIGHKLYEIPTAEQMVGWLEEQGIIVETVKCEIFWFSRVYSGENIYFNKGRFVSRKEAILAAIDAAIEKIIQK